MGRGSGAVRARADGRWEVRMTVTEADGHRARRSWYADTRADAYALLDRLRVEQATGTLPDSNPPIGAVLDAWLAYLTARTPPPTGSQRAPTLRPGTLRTYRIF